MRGHQPRLCLVVGRRRVNKQSAFLCCWLLEVGNVERWRRRRGETQALEQQSPAVAVDQVVIPDEVRQEPQDKDVRVAEQGCVVRRWLDCDVPAPQPRVLADQVLDLPGECLDVAINVRYLDRQPLRRGELGGQCEIGQQILEGLAQRELFGALDREIRGVRVEHVAVDEPLALGVDDVAQRQRPAGQFRRTIGHLQRMGLDQVAPAQRKLAVLFHLETQRDFMAQVVG